MVGIRKCLNDGVSRSYNGFVVQRVLLIRHGETVCNNNLMKYGLGKVDINSQLTKRGVKQASDIDVFLRDRKYLPSSILTSPLDRSINTAKKFITPINLEIDTSLAEINTKEDMLIINNKEPWIYQKESQSNFRRRIKEWMDKQMSIGTLKFPQDTLVYTHSGVIATILGMYPSYIGEDSQVNRKFYDANGNIICVPSYVKNEDYSLNHRYHVANGSITCLDILERPNGERFTHVLTVNYTRHLSEPTGHHCNLV